MFILALLTSAITASIGAIFSGFLLYQLRKNTLVVKDTDEDLNTLIEDHKWLAKATPNEQFQRIVDTNKRISDTIAVIQRALNDGDSLNPTQTENGYRSIVKAANAVNGILTSITMTTSATSAPTTA